TLIGLTSGDIFFFQAEDGIRDFHVTGVQTCALPILLGPLALNIAAPDEGNMHLLEKVATPEQRERYLVPLAAGEIRSCFAMTERSEERRVGKESRSGGTASQDSREEVRATGEWTATP